MALRYDYTEDLDEKTKALLQKAGRHLSRLPLCVLPIPPSAISADGTEWLHCVEAKKGKDFIRVRVVTNNRGINITIYSFSQEMYQKYLDLRFKVRNSDYVAITFPEIYIGTSPCVSRELYLTARDFRLFDATKDQKPSIII